MVISCFHNHFSRYGLRANNSAQYQDISCIVGGVGNNMDQSAANINFLIIRLLI